MRFFKSKVVIAAGLLASSRLVACSPSAGNNGLGISGANGAGGHPSSDASIGSGNAAGYVGTGGDGIVMFGNGGGTPGGGNTGAGGGCPEVIQKPEQILTYKDATVTDTIVTFAPVALFVMQDRSGSMITGFPAGSPNSWPNSIAAMQAFTTDPASAGLDVGLGYFPPTSNAPDSSCMGCATPVVPIQAIGQAGPAIISSMNSNAPNPLNFTPLQCGLQGMIDACKTYMQQSSGEKCVAVFVTDGNTTDPAYLGCDTNTTDLLKIVSDGKAAGVETFAIGMVPTALTFLNQVAQAGGTNTAIDVSGGSAAFITALNGIRDKVTLKTSHQVTTTTTISTPLPCEWTIPAPTDGTTFNKNQVNVRFTPQGGQATDFGYTDQASCANVQNGWYYDDPNNPTKVLLCDNTCTMVKAATGAEVDVGFGCDQKKAIPK
jgi:hypothetical protein